MTREYIRQATSADVAAMVALADQKRREYEQYQPQFWRVAKDAVARQIPYVESLLGRDNVIALVQEQQGVVNGFIIATLTPPPPVYDPGGLACVVDDYAVRETSDWTTVGQALLNEVERRARQRGAAVLVTICGHLDQPKRAMLQDSGASIASEWWVKSIT